jgi:Tfp pilus assembly protein PilO
MTRRVGLFALIAVVVVVAGWYAVFWRSENAHLAAARAQERGTLFGLEVQHKKLAQDEATLHQLIKALPNGPSLDEMMDTLNAAATQSGVVIGTVSTPTPQSWASSAPVSNGSSSQLTGPGPESIDVSLTVGGTEAQVLNFVKALDDQPRIYVVNSFALTAAGAGPLLPGTHETASLSVNMFFESASSSSPVFPG